MIKKITFLTALMFFALSFSFASQKDERAFVKGIRPMSMGGAFVAVADDQNAFFYNPAGIAQRSGKLIQFFSFDMAVNTETVDFFKFFLDNKDDLKNFDDLSPSKQAALLNKINKDILDKAPNLKLALPDFAFISGPLKISDNYLSVGAGLFSYADASFRFNRSIIVPSLTYKGQATVVAAVPVAYKINSLEGIRLPGKLSLGTNFKYIYRGISQVDDLSIDEFDKFDIPVQDGGGFGIDFGLIYHINTRWNVGVQLADALTTKIKYSDYNDDKHPSRSKDSYTAEIDPELTIGAAYVPEKVYYWPGKSINTNNRLTVAADIADMANDDETITDSFWKKVHFGAEFRFSPFAVRAGFNSGYPAIGGGIATNYLNIEYAFYGEEDGLYAGQDPQWFHRLLFSVKIGNSKGKEYGNALKNKEKVSKEKISKESKKKDKLKQSGQEQSAVEEIDDTEPLKIPADAKDIIEKPAEINEVEQ